MKFLYMYIIIITFSCRLNHFEQTIKQKKSYYIVKINNVYLDTLAYGSPTYFLVYDYFDSIFNLNKNNFYYSGNGIKYELIKKNAIPIFEEPIKVWKLSCENKKFTLKVNSYPLWKKDSMIFSNNLKILHNDSFYLQNKIKLKNPRVDYYIMGISKVNKINFCKIPFITFIKDSSVIINGDFKLSLPITHISKPQQKR